MSQTPPRNAKTSLSANGRLFVATTAALGLGVVALSLIELAHGSISSQWLVLAGLTLLSGSFTVKIPSIASTISVSETFVIASVLLFGTSAGTLTVALDALIITIRIRHRGNIFRILFNLSAGPLAIWCGGWVFQLISGASPQASNLSLPELVLPLTGLTFTYFMVNSWLVATALSFEKGEGALRLWVNNFLWLSVNYFGGASVAALLVSYTRTVDLTAVGIIVPLLVISYLTFKTSLGRVEDANRHVDEVKRLYLTTIESLATAIDAKDQVTHGHIRRVQRYAVGLAKALGVNDDKQIQAIEAAALLHDMGKLAIPEFILNKPGKLSVQEFEVMKTHAAIGADILSSIQFPYPVVPIVRSHHENWDGTGYPDGIKGAQIPIGARVLSVVDCFDALTSDRPYRPALSEADAIEILMNRRGNMYDPLVVDTFVRVLPDLASELTDTPPPLTTETIQRITEISSTTPAEINEPTDTEEPRGALLSLVTLLATLPKDVEPIDLCTVLHARLAQLLGSEGVVLYLVGPKGTELVVAATGGAVPADFAGSLVPFGSRVSGWVAANRVSVRNSDATLEFMEFSRGARTVLMAPLIAGEALTGVFGATSSKADAFTPDHQRVLELISDQLATLVAVPSAKNGTSTLETGPRKFPGALELDRLLSAPPTAFQGWAPTTVASYKLREEAAETPTRAWTALRTVLRLSDLMFVLGDGTALVVLPRTTADAAKGVIQRIEASVFAVELVATRTASDTTEPLVATVKRLAPPSLPQNSTSISPAIH